MAVVSQLIIPHRFCGPPSSGNGGWTSGELAAHVEHGCPEDRSDAWPTIQVSLRRPPPLDTVLDVAETAGVTAATLDGTPVAEASLVDSDPVPVEPVPFDEARAAEASYPGLVSHPFPTCFVCGTAREEGDGLRIFPGPVGSADGTAGCAQRVAATWTPHPSLSEDWHTYVDGVSRTSLATTWAALDCTGGWAGDLTERLMVLGRMTARIDALPVVGEPHVVVGEHRGAEGRKTFTASTLYDSDGRVVGSAEHTWIAVDPKDFA